MRNLFRNVAVATVVFLSAQYANAQQKIGHVNADDVFQLTAEFKAANEQLKTLNDTKTKELQDMFQTIGAGNVFGKLRQVWSDQTNENYWMYQLFEKAKNFKTWSNACRKINV